MANSIADMIVASGLQSSKEVPDLAGSLTKGVELASHIERTKQAREQIEMQKQQHQLNKVDKLTSAMEVGAKIKSKSARNAYFKNYIPQMQAALGLQDFIPPETMAMIQADPEEAKKFSLLKSKIMNGEMTYDAAVSAMDPEQWAMLDDAEVLQLEAAEKFRVQQAGADKRSPNNRLWDQHEDRQLTQLNNDIRNAYKPIENTRTALKNAYDSLLKVKSDIDAGKKESSIDFNVAARGLAKAFNSGAMSDADVDDFRRLTGVTDITESNIKRWITGGAPKEAVRSLIGVAERSAANVDAQAAEIANSFEGRYSNFSDPVRARKNSGINAFSSPTLQTKGSDSKIADYAKQYNLSYDQAAKILTKRGYKPGSK